MKVIAKYLAIGLCNFLIFYNMNAWYHPMSSWVQLMVEEVAQEFEVKTPVIYQEMHSFRVANPHLTPTCTDIRLQFGNLIIGDRLLAKLDYPELKLLVTRAFVCSKQWYKVKKALMVSALFGLNAYAFNAYRDKGEPLHAVGIFICDVLAYLGFNIYVEKMTDRQALEITGSQEILDAAYQKISPNRWPLSKWPSFYKNVARYIGF